MESCLCFILLADISSIEMLACFYLWTHLHTHLYLYSGSLWHPESSGRLFFLKSPLSWGCIMVVAHKCPVNEILGHSELKLGQNKTSCPWCCCFTYEEFWSRDRLWIYLEVGTWIWKVLYWRYGHQHFNLNCYNWQMASVPSLVGT